MSLGVGGFARARHTIRSTPNPIDKCTVVSILPKLIEERKPTIEPGYFRIEPGTYENPAILVVGMSSWWRDIDPEQPLLEIPVSSIQIADSVVKDYCNGIVGCNMGDSMPGLFYVPGEHNVASVKTSFKKQLDEAAVKQKKWYQNLIKMADVLWARTNGNPLVIMDDARMAAKFLGLDNKEWMSDAIRTNDLIRCAACGALRDPNYPVCGSCKAIIDQDKAKKLNLQFART